MVGGYSAIIAAGGGASRFGGLGQLKEKLGGKSVLCHGIDNFEADDDCSEVILVASPAVRAWVAGDPLTFASPKLKLVDGGPSRAASIAAGVRAAQGKLVALHDGNRPNFSESQLSRLKATVMPGRGAALGLALNDSLAYISAIGADGSGNGANPPAGGLFSSAKADHRLGHVMEHVTSGMLFALQTPQFYYRDSFLTALDHAGAGLAEYGDDTALYIDGGFEVAVVAGYPGNIKVVSEADFNLLLKLMGGGTKKPKDKYGGLGW